QRSQASNCQSVPFFSRKHKCPLAEKSFSLSFLALFSIALILGWYFYTLRSELGSLTQQRAQEAVLQSIAAIEDYFKPAEAVVEAGPLFVLEHILGVGQAGLIGRECFLVVLLRPLLSGG